MRWVGPGFLVAVGYMDPGNWATDLAGGAQFGYPLLCGHPDLEPDGDPAAGAGGPAGHRHRARPRPGLPRRTTRGRSRSGSGSSARSPSPPATWPRSSARRSRSSSSSALPLLGRRRPDRRSTCWSSSSCRTSGFRYVEALVIALIATIGLCFGVEMCPGPARHRRACWRGFIPTPEIVSNPAALYIAIGILGATVMPHNLYLHSSIVQTRAVRRDAATGKREAVQYATIDSTLALMLRAVHQRRHPDPRGGGLPRDRQHRGRRDRGRLPAADAAARHGAGQRRCSRWRCSPPGQNSTLTGTLAGQIVMEGFLNIRIRPWLRRLITRLIAIIPAVIVVWLYGERGTALLILSQVVLQPAALVRGLPAPAVHQRPGQDGRVRQPALGEGARLRDRRSSSPRRTSTCSTRRSPAAACSASRSRAASRRPSPARSRRPRS